MSYSSSVRILVQVFNTILGTSSYPHLDVVVIFWTQDCDEPYVSEESRSDLPIYV